MEKNRIEESFKTYAEIREECIRKYKKLYKDSLVFDLCKVDKATRVKLLEDPVYIAETKSLKADLFVQQIDKLDEVLGGIYAEEGKDQSQTILKALDMKQKLLLEDIGINDDVKNALNIAFIAMSKEDFESLDTIEIEEGSGNTELAGDFGMQSDDMSAEEKAKKLLAQKQAEAKQNANKEEV